jgi:hypothetical protein
MKNPTPAPYITVKESSLVYPSQIQ